MNFLRVILFIAIVFVLGCGKSAPATNLSEGAAKSKEEAEKNAEQRGQSMKTKNEFMSKGMPPPK
jgi:hypothetical protein